MADGRHRDSIWPFLRSLLTHGRVGWVVAPGALIWANDVADAFGLDLNVPSWSVVIATLVGMMVAAFLVYHDIRAEVTARTETGEEVHRLKKGVEVLGVVLRIGKSHLLSLQAQTPLPFRDYSRVHGDVQAWWDMALMALEPLPAQLALFGGREHLEALDFSHVTSPNTNINLTPLVSLIKERIPVVEAALEALGRRISHLEDS